MFPNSQFTLPFCLYDLGQSTPRRPIQSLQQLSSEVPGPRAIEQARVGRVSLLSCKLCWGETLSYSYLDFSSISSLIFEWVPVRHCCVLLSPKACWSLSSWPWFFILGLLCLISFPFFPQNLESSPPLPIPCHFLHLLLFMASKQQVWRPCLFWIR